MDSEAGRALRPVVVRYSIYAACVVVTAVVVRVLTAGSATDPGGDPDGATLEAIPVVLAVGVAGLLLAAVELGTLWAIRRRKQTLAH